MSVYTEKELLKLGFKSLGRNVRISTKASFYGANKISIGNNVRIDDFCVISAGEGGVFIGDYIHVAVYSSLIGSGKIVLQDFCNISSRVAIYSSNDDYSGEFMTNPMVPSQFTNVTHADVEIGKHVIVGTGSVILPGVALGEGTAVGALSLVNRSSEPYSIVVGNPAKKVKERSRQLINVELEFQKSLGRLKGA